MTQTVVAVSTKNPGLAALLAIVFGPIGMLYSTIPGALVMLVVTVIVGLVTFGLGVFLTWPVCVIWAMVAAVTYNSRIRRQAAEGTL